MLSNRLAFAVLVVGCMAAAAGGGYLATRQNAIPAVAEGATSPSLQAERSSTGRPVRQTEPIVEEGVLQSAPAPAGAPAARSVTAATPKRSDTARAAVQAPAATRAAGPAHTSAASDPSLSIDHPAAGNPTVNVPQTPPVATLPAPPPPSAETPAQTPKPEERAAQEPPRQPDPPQKIYEELVVRAESVIGLQSQTSVSSERARVEDRVEARVSRDVRVRDMVAVPAGTQAIGSVVSVERGGKFKERARLGIRFNTLVLADGTHLQISTETIYRDGDSPGKESAAKVGGATAAGAILGAIFGGGKGAAIGAAAGGGAGSATVAAGERNPATLRAGEPITVRILSPISVTIEQK